MNPLTASERDELKRLIDAGRPLPEKWRARLFPDSPRTVEVGKEYRLVYDGKARREEVLSETPPAPWQLVRRFCTGRPFEDGWRNLLVWGDNLLALRELLADQRGPNRFGARDRIKLIYIDPPFATRQDFMKDREKAYRDKVLGAQFIEFLRRRLILLREVLADDGSIYVHLDYKKGHYIKAVLDEVFGEENFLSEIIWQRTTNTGSSKALAQKFSADTDSIYVYTKSEGYIFNKQYRAYSADYLARFKYDDKDGKGPYRWQYMATFSEKKIQELRSRNELRWPDQSKNPEYKQYLESLKGVPISNLWDTVHLPFPTYSPSKTPVESLRA